MGGDGADGGQHGVVDGSSIIEESAQNFLDTGGFRCIEHRSVVMRGVLLSGPIVRRSPLVGGMFRSFWFRMLQAMEGTFNVARHGNVYRAIGVVPFEGEAYIAFTQPILADAVDLAEGVHQLFGDGCFGVADAKAVHNKGEH